MRTQTTRKRLEARTIAGFNKVSGEGSGSNSLPTMSGDGQDDVGFAKSTRF